MVRPGQLNTRAVADAITGRYTERAGRAGRAIQTTATLLTVLMEHGWAVGRKRGRNPHVRACGLGGGGLRRPPELAVANAVIPVTDLGEARARTDQARSFRAF